MLGVHRVASHSRSPAPDHLTTETRIMRLDTSQQMRTEMRLRMAPRMIQSMEILQLPIMALQERIEQELGENPVLEDAGKTSVNARSMVKRRRRWWPSRSPMPNRTSSTA